MKLALISLLVMSGAAYSAAPISNISNSGLSEQIVQLKRLIQARGAAQVNLQQQLTELQEELSDLRGETETHAHKLDQIVNRQRELYIEIERRLENIQQPTTMQPAVSESTETATDDSSFSASLSENEAYDRAVNLILKEKRYDDAIPEFEVFIQKFPNSVYSANAHYWLGQLLFTKSNFQQASVHFTKVISSYPDSNKRSNALLKQGMVMQKLDKIADAKKLFQQVVDEYPDSDSATLAKSRLASIQ